MQPSMRPSAKCRAGPHSRLGDLVEALYEGLHFRDLRREKCIYDVEGVFAVVRGASGRVGTDRELAGEHGGKCRFALEVAHLPAPMLDEPSQGWKRDID